MGGAFSGVSFSLNSLGLIRVPDIFWVGVCLEPGWDSSAGAIPLEMRDPFICGSTPSPPLNVCLEMHLCLCVKALCQWSWLRRTSPHSSRIFWLLVTAKKTAATIEHTGWAATWAFTLQMTHSSCFILMELEKLCRSMTEQKCAFCPKFLLLCLIFMPFFLSTSKDSWLNETYGQKDTWTKR